MNYVGPLRAVIHIDLERVKALNVAKLLAQRIPDGVEKRSGVRLNFREKVRPCTEVMPASIADDPLAYGWITFEPNFGPAAPLTLKR